MKTVTLTAHGRYLIVSFLPDEEVARALRSSERVRWKPGLGGWVSEVRDVAGLVVHLKALGLAVRFGPVVGPRRTVAIVPGRAPPRPSAPVDPEVLRSFAFRPSDVARPALAPAFVARWREPGELPAIEPVNVGALDLAFDVPRFTGRLYRFQREGVAFLRALGYRGILADEMGLGKTAQAIAAALLAGDRTLVVSPASVKYNWVAEVRKFTDVTARVLNGRTFEGPSDAFFTIANYDVLTRNLDRLNAEKFGTLVLDEAHFVKNPRARRSRAAYALEAPRRILLTGTPLLNRPEELYPLLDLASPGKWGTERDFRHRFTRRVTRLAPDGRTVGGAAGAHLADLRERLRGVMIRRRKEDVLRELPPKVIEVQPVPLPDDARPAYEALERDLADHLASEGLDAAFRGHSWMRTLAKMHALKQFTIAERLPAARAWIAERALDGEKVVVFSQYLSPLHDLHRALDPSSLLIDGSVASEERLARANRLASDPAIVALVGQIQAAGVGLNFTAARHVLFLDLAWTPAAHAQATDRCHRIGQSREVRVTFLVSPGTIDDHLQRILLEKQAIINTVMGERQETITEPRAMRRVAEAILQARA